ncbi:MAG: TonB-dependent receptor [Lentimicrobium sp.]|nr:TonB-dependent receptor [Lentimicrobium sp.]
MRKLNLLLVFMLLTVMQVLAQRTITGTVTGKDDGQGIPGVSVSIKGTTQGTTTDINGKYSLSVPGETSVLVYSFVGMKKVEFPVPASGVLNVVMESEAIDVEGVVVVGYGVMRKSDVTGSVGKVNVEELKKVTTIDAAQALQGRVSGVNVISNSGNPGSGVKIRVRGVGTINNSDPLFVVDGFPMSDMSHIAPGDIESLEVLKDASATAIYGSRGANGVILVKTRTGSKSKKFEVQANVQTGISQVGRQLELADAVQFAQARKTIGLNDEIIDYVLEQYEAGNYLKGTDWQKEIYRQGVNTRYNVSVLGNSEGYSYDHGFTYSNEEGIVKGTYLDKLTFRSNNNMKLTEKVNLGLNFNFVHYERPGERTDYYSGTIPGALRSDPISAAWDNYTNFYGEVYYSQAATNPALSIYLSGKDKYKGNRAMGNAFLQIDDLFTKGLSFRSQAGVQLDFDDQKSYSPKYFITPTQKNDDASLYQRRPYGFNWVNTNYFSYNKSVSKLNINATLGSELQASRWTDIWARGYDVPENADLQYLGAHKDAIKFALGGGSSENRIASSFFRGNFSWDNKYVFTGTMRVDGSSKFTPEKRWGYFPSVAASWNIHNEEFMTALSDVLPSLKLRAGWGVVGNQGSAGNFDYVSSVNGGYMYALNGLPIEGAVQLQLANRELSWESAEQINVGVDFELFNSQLTGTMDYFIRNTKDMILQRPIPLYAGKRKPAVNAGTMQNRGLEFALNYAQRSKDFKYDVGFNLTFIKNEITSLAGGDPIRGGSAGRVGSTTRTEVGREIAYFYGYETAGIFKTQEQLDAHAIDGTPIQPNAGLGDVIFKDLNGDGKITELDMTYLGSASPDFTGGFNLNMSYKGFDMVMFIYGSFGNEIINSMYQTLYSTKMFETNISKDMALNHWSPENPNSDVPRLDAADLNKNAENFSDLYVEDGSYLRLKNLQFGYTMPAKITQKIQVKSMRVYASFDNLITLTKYTGLDPELFGLYGNPFYYGVDLVNYPQPRMYSIGLNISL